MNESLRATYRRLVGFLRPQLSQGSTIRALMLALTPGAVVGGVVAEHHLAIGMLVAGVVAALIPDELPW